MNRLRIPTIIAGPQQPAQIGQRGAPVRASATEIIGEPTYAADVPKGYANQFLKRNEYNWVDRMSPTHGPR